MEINGTRATFEISIVGEKTQETYKGKFTVECMPTPLEIIAADKTYRQLLGDSMVYATTKAKDLAFILAELSIRIKEAPPFWPNPDRTQLDGGHIIDMNILHEILNKSIEAQDEFLSEKKKEQEELEKILKEKLEKNKIKREEEKIEDTPIEGAETL